MAIIDLSTGALTTSDEDLESPSLPDTSQDPATATIIDLDTGQRVPFSPVGVEALEQDPQEVTQTLQGNLLQSVTEPLSTIATGVVAEPIAGIAGLGAAALDVIPGVDIDAAGVVESTRQALTDEPETQRGQAGLRTIGDLVAAGVDLANVPISGLAGLAELITGQGVEQAVKTIGGVQKEGLGKTAGARTFDIAGSPALAAAVETAPTAVLEIAGLKGVNRLTKTGSKQIAQDTVDINEAVAARSARKASEETGVGLFKAQQTLNPTDIERQAFVAQLPEGANRAREALSKQNQQVFDAVTEFMGDLAPPESVSSAASKFRGAAQKALEGEKLIRRQKTSPLYNAAFDAGAEVNLSPIRDFIASELAELPEAGEISKSLKRVSGLIAGKKPKETKAGLIVDQSGKPITASTRASASVSLKQLHNAKLEIDQMLNKIGTDSLGNTTKAKLAEAKDLLVSQIDQASPAYLEARKAFEAASPPVTKLNDSIVGSIAGYDDKQLKSIARRVFDPAEANTTNIQNAKRAISDVDPDAWNVLFRSEIERRMGSIRTDIGDLSTVAATENVPAQLFNSVFGNKKSRDVLFAAADESTKKNLKYLETILKRASRGRPGGSQTGIRSEISRELKGGVFQSLRNFIKKPIEATGSIGEEAAFNSKVKALSNALFDPQWKGEMAKIRKLSPASSEAKRAMDKLLASSLLTAPTIIEATSPQEDKQ
jgi:hypothetical protein